MKKFIILTFGFLLAFISIEASPEKTTNPCYSIEELTDFEQISIASININATAISDYDVPVSSETLYSIYVLDNPIFCYTDYLKFSDKRLIYEDSGIYKSFYTQINSFTSNIGYNKHISLELKPIEKDLIRTKIKFLS